MTQETVSVSDNLKRSMVITVIAVRVMKMAINEIVDVIAVRHGLVTTARTMDMPGFMAGTTVFRRATVRVLFTHFNHMLIDMILMRMMKVTVMQIIDMVPMANSGMTAARTVFMCVVGVMRMVALSHFRFLPLKVYSRFRSRAQRRC